MEESNTLTMDEKMMINEAIIEVLKTAVESLEIKGKKATIAQMKDEINVAQKDLALARLVGFIEKKREGEVEKEPAPDPLYLAREAERVLCETLHKLNMEKLMETDGTVTIKTQDGEALSLEELQELRQAAWNYRSQVHYTGGGVYTISRMVYED